MLGTEAEARGIRGIVKALVRKGDMYNNADKYRRSGKVIPYQGETFIVIMDGEGNSHHALLGEVAERCPTTPSPSPKSPASSLS